MRENSSIQINKIKYSEKAEKTTIDFSRNIDGHQADYTGTFDEQAAPEFYTALQVLRNPVLNILQFKFEDFKDRITPYGVNYRYAKDGTMSAIISSKLAVGNTKIEINTPMRSCPTEDIVDETSEQYFDDPTVAALWELETQARKYLDGKRAQMSLFGSDGSESISDEREKDPFEEDEDVPSGMPKMDNIAAFPTAAHS